MLKTIAAMDLDKINMDLVESLLEWIVDGKHDSPPGKRLVKVHSKLCRIFIANFMVEFIFWFLCPGAVLVFLPGLAEIKMLYEQLMSNRMFNNRGATRSVTKVVRLFCKCNSCYCRIVIVTC